MTRSAQLSYFNNLQYRRVGHRPITGTYSDSNSRALNYKYPDWHQVKFTTPWRSNMVLDASYSRLRYDDLWAPQPEVVLGTVSRYETTSDGYTYANPTYPDWDDYRDQVFAQRQRLHWAARHHGRLPVQICGPEGQEYLDVGHAREFHEWCSGVGEHLQRPDHGRLLGAGAVPSLGQDQRVLCAGQVETNQEACRGSGPPFRDRFRLAAAIVLGDQRVRRSAVFLGNQRRSAISRPSCRGFLPCTI